MENFSSNSLVLTPNRRLANFLISQSNTLTRPTILDWQSWIKWLWEQAEETIPRSLPLLITSQASSVLWQHIVNDPVAASVEQAWNLVQQWCDNSLSTASLQTEEHHAFWNWQAEYRKQLTDRQQIDLTQLGNALPPLLPQLLPHIPNTVYLVHFSEFTPQQLLFIETLKAIKRKVVIVQPTGTARSTHLVVADSLEHELALMMSWIKDHIQHEKSIICVYPELTTLRPQLERQFSYYFPDQFEISASPTLAEYPIISSAFSLFALVNDTIATEDFSRVLRSPFIGAAETEYQQRHLFDAQCRDFHASNWRKSAIVALTQQANIPHFVKYLQGSENLISEESVRPASQWALQFSRYLAAFQWPGEKSLSSVEYQCLQRWRVLLSEFASVDQVRPDGFTFQQAINHLHHFAKHTDFQPQSSRKKLQILGLLEAAGMPSSTLWLQGFTAEAWPPVAHPNPFIPLTLQKKVGMPHASPEREYRYAQGIQQQYQSCAETVIASYSRSDSGRVCMPSPFIKGYSTVNIAESTQPLAAIALHHTQKIEFYSEFQATVEPLLDLKGGSQVLKMQSACPFQAFAHFRLKAHPLSRSTLGLSPLERGLLIHTILENFWKSLPSQSALFSLSAEHLATLLHNTIQQALIKIPTGIHLRIHPTVIALEQQRLEILLQQWIAIEKERAPFTIHALEAKHTLQLLNTTINCRIDRIDQLANGEYVIVDYKTSQIDPRDCLGERPLEPQLPLYSLLSPKISSIAFAQIRTQGVQWKPLKHPDLSWETLRADWEKSLSQLLIEYQSGQAQVSPQSSSICQRCASGSLCRINALA